MQVNSSLTAVPPLPRAAADCITYCFFFVFSPPPGKHQLAVRGANWQENGSKGVFPPRQVRCRWLCRSYVFDSLRAVVRPSSTLRDSVGPLCSCPMLVTHPPRTFLYACLLQPTQGRVGPKECIGRRVPSVCRLGAGKYSTIFSDVDVFFFPGKSGQIF